MTTEKCTICGEEKPLDQFSKSARNEKRGGRHGRRSDCKECQKETEAGRKSVSHTSYRDRILAVMHKHTGPIDIHALRDEFAKSPAAQSGVSSALVNMRDRGEVRITGGGHSNSAKMVEIIPEFSVPNGRIVRLSDARHWDEPPIRSRGASLQSGMPYMELMCG